MKRKMPVEKLDNTKARLPNHFVYKALSAVISLLNLKYHPQYVYHFDKKEMKGKQVMLLSDHASRDTWKYSICGYPFTDLNIVVGMHNMLVPGAYWLFQKIGAIPKYLYERDVKSVRKMLRILSMGGSLCFFPEGIQSATGSNHPINPATAGFIKKAGITVVLCKSYGSFLSSPRQMRHTQKGHKEFHYEILFTPEQLKQMSKDEIYDKLLERFRYNDFEWNSDKHYKYTGKYKNSYGLDWLLYICPKCGSEFKIKVENDELVCTECGNRVRVNDSFELEKVNDETFLPYKNIDHWYKSQRRKVLEEIKDPDFSLSFDCYVGDLHTEKLTFEQYYLCGEGKLTIDKDGMHYCGTHHEKNVALDFDIINVPSAYYIPNQEISIYYNGGYYYFTPKEDSKKVVKYSIAVEELHNLVDPAWNKASRDAYDLKADNKEYQCMT